MDGYPADSCAISPTALFLVITIECNSSEDSLQPSAVVDYIQQMEGKKISPNSSSTDGHDQENLNIIQKKL